MLVDEKVSIIIFKLVNYYFIYLNHIVSGVVEYCIMQY
jgi:hypothetical protein